MECISEKVQACARLEAVPKPRAICNNLSSELKHQRVQGKDQAVGAVPLRSPLRPPL